MRYVPGSGETEAEDNYYGNTTQNTAYPVASTTRVGTAGAMNYVKMRFFSDDIRYTIIQYVDYTTTDMNINHIILLLCRCILLEQRGL